MAIYKSLFTVSLTCTNTSQHTPYYITNTSQHTPHYITNTSQHTPHYITNTSQHTPYYITNTSQHTPHLTAYTTLHHQHLTTYTILHHCIMKPLDGLTTRCRYVYPDKNYGCNIAGHVPDACHAITKEC